MSQLAPDSLPANPPAQLADDLDRRVVHGALHAGLPVLTGTSLLNVLIELGADDRGGLEVVVGLSFSCLFLGLGLLGRRDSSTWDSVPWLPSVVAAACWVQAAFWLIFHPELIALPAAMAAASSWWLLSSVGLYCTAAAAVFFFAAMRLTSITLTAWIVTGSAMIALFTFGVRVHRAGRRETRGWLGRVVAQLAELAEERSADSRKSTDADGAEESHNASRTLEAHGQVDGLWQWDLVTDQVYLSPHWRALLGHEDEAVTCSLKDWLNLIHTHDLAEFMAGLRAHLAGEADRFEVEHRIRQADTSYRWVLSHGRVILDAHGKPERFAGSQVDLMRMKNYEVQLVHQATHDRLTGLPNREKLHELLEREVNRKAQSPGYLFALAFLDLDDFKGVNDTLGHLAGDELLRQVAHRLEDAVGVDNSVARLGGDEFVLLIRGVRNAEEAIQIAQRAEAALDEPFTLGADAVRIEVSVGVTVCDSGGLSPDQILRNADIAMYAAKKGSQGPIRLFDFEMGSKAARRLEIQTRLRKAFEEHQFELFYQPIVAAQDGRIVCAEALMRWRRADGEITPPNEFIPLAEEIGLIQDLGRWALEEACRQVVEWHEAGLPQLEVSVNVSAKQLGQDFVEAAKTVLCDTGLDARKLQLEITESALVEGRDHAPEILDRLALLGVKTAIDDFGVGYSSFSYLRSLRCDTLKIDRSFISELAADLKAAAIVRSIIGLAHNLDLSVVAEGVETPFQIDFLRGAGCDRLQGYFASRPVPAHEFRKLLESGGRLHLGREHTAGNDRHTGLILCPVLSQSPR